MKRYTNFLTSILFSLYATVMGIPTANADEVIGKSNQLDSRCTKTPFLYRNIDQEKRVTSLTPVDSKVLLSQHYCIGFTEHLGSTEGDITFSLNDVIEMVSRYRFVWSVLDGDEKVSFAHMFLKRLSRQTLILPSTRTENEITVFIPGSNSTGRKTYFPLAVNVVQQDYWLIESGLIALSMNSDDSEQLKNSKVLKQWLKWVIRGGEQPSDLTLAETTLLPNGGLVYCMECYYYSIDELRNQGGGGGSSISYNVNWYFDYGYTLDLDEAVEWEQQQCSVHNDCEVQRYFDDMEECVMVIYDDYVISGLYCVIDDL